jgi:hypothetical protein
MRPVFRFLNETNELPIGYEYPMSENTRALQGRAIVSLVIVTVLGIATAYISHAPTDFRVFLLALIAFAFFEQFNLLFSEQDGQPTLSTERTLIRLTVAVFLGLALYKISTLDWGRRWLEIFLAPDHPLRSFLSITFVGGLIILYHLLKKDYLPSRERK